MWLHGFYLCHSEKLVPVGMTATASTLLTYSDAGMNWILCLLFLLQCFDLLVTSSKAEVLQSSRLSRIWHSNSTCPSVRPFARHVLVLYLRRKAGTDKLVEKIVKHDGQSSLISFTHHCYDWHPGSCCGWTCNQLSRWRHNWKSAQVVSSHPVCDPTIWQPGFCCAAFAVMRCLSVTFMSCVKTNKHII